MQQTQVQADHKFVGTFRGWGQVYLLYPAWLGTELIKRKSVIVHSFDVVNFLWMKPVTVYKRRAPCLCIRLGAEQARGYQYHGIWPRVSSILNRTIQFHC